MNSLGRLSARGASLRATPLASASTPTIRRAALVRAGSARHASDLAPGAPLKKTPLYEFHVASGARLVPFAGYHMPVQYASQSIADSHHFTRTQASLFDVSHMVQHTLRGPAAAAFLERVTPSSWRDQGFMQSKLTTLLWPETGGIVDDTVVTRIGEDEFYVVTNGACLDKDTSYLDEQLGRFGGGVEWTRLDGSGLVALQGPRSAEVLNEVLARDGAHGAPDLRRLFFGNATRAEIRLPGGGTTCPVLISRGGYTGEDGFEIAFDGRQFPSAAWESTVRAVEALLAAGGPERVRMAGLGARDSLRLEAGMCLYGHDLDDTTTPVEAGLSWIIPPGRRAAGGFHGAEVILPQLTPRSKGGRGVDRRRVGFVVQGAPAREGAIVVSREEEGREVGVITSGVPSPSLGKNIAMGYVKDGMHKVGTEVDVVVRGRKRPAVVAKMPFLPPSYFRAPA